MRWPSNNAMIRFIFFGNYFYGLCAIALSIEASLQQQYSLNSLLYYAIVFCATILKSPQIPLIKGPFGMCNIKDGYPFPKNCLP